MENATKALIIAAGMLMGIMILSLGVYLYFSLGQYITTTQIEMEANALNKFNTQYTQYVNYDDVGNRKFEVTIQDIITLANIAYENNESHGLTGAPSTYSTSTYYVAVNIKNVRNNLEKQVATQSAEILSQYLNKKYKCIPSNVKVSNTTGRVYSITFEEVI